MCLPNMKGFVFTKCTLSTQVHHPAEKSSVSFWFQSVFKCFITMPILCKIMDVSILLLQYFKYYNWWLQSVPLTEMYSLLQILNFNAGGREWKRTHFFLKHCWIHYFVQASFFSLFFSVSRNGHKDMDQRLHWKSVII